MPLTHRQLAARVTTMARAAGVHVHSCDMVGCDPGFPDLVLIGRRGQVLWRELKVEPDDLSREQKIVGLYRLRAGGHDFGVWTEMDLRSGRIGIEIRAIA